MNGTLVGLDTAKSVFHLVISDRPGHIRQDKRLSREQLVVFLAQLAKATIVMEACGSAYYWAHTFMAMGHEVVLLPAHAVKPYVRRNKTDRADAKALLEAYRNEDIRPVPVKTVEQQAVMSLHAVRSQWMRQKVACINSLRGMLREHGHFLRTGAKHLVGDVMLVIEDADSRLPGVLRPFAAELCDEIRDLERRIDMVEAQLKVLAKDSELVRSLMRITGVGLLTATAMFGYVGDLHRFPTARHFASYLGLTPREHSSGNRRRLGHISKAGNSYLRYLLIHGARAALVAGERVDEPDNLRRWAIAVKARTTHNKAAVALANKIARIIWVVATKHGRYNPDLACTKAA